MSGTATVKEGIDKADSVETRPGPRDPKYIVALVASEEQSPIGDATAAGAGAGGGNVAIPEKSATGGNGGEAGAGALQSTQMDRDAVLCDKEKEHKSVVDENL